MIRPRNPIARALALRPKPGIIPSRKWYEADGNRAKRVAAAFEVASEKTGSFGRGAAKRLVADDS